MHLEIGTYLRPFFGERMIGDAIVTSVNNNFTYLVVIDGIGHGPKAAIISSAIKSFIEKNWIPNPSELIEKVHYHMKGSEGAVIGISVINHKESTLLYAGLGNITCRIIGSTNKSMVSADGLLGVRLRSVQNSRIVLNDKDLIIMHSDGVSSSSSSLIDFPKLQVTSSRLLAKKIVQVFGSEYDDVSCIIVKCKIE
jgi:serine/threonine protein phosphatase PrpC